MTYHLHQLDPIPVRLPGQRSQQAQWAVVQGGAVIAVFVDERRADSYMRRLRAWQQQNRRSAV